MAPSTPVPDDGDASSMRIYLRSLFCLLACAIFLCVSTGVHAEDLYDYMANRYDVDATLLRAIARAESQGYPWTVDLDGSPFFFSDKARAIAFADELKTRPWLVVVEFQRSADKPEERYLFADQKDARAFETRLKGISHYSIRFVDIENIDLGVMQINWKYHGDQVPSLSRLMDPDYNIAYGAFYLSKLIHKYGNVWEAVGYYHSSTPSEQKRYIAEVKSIYTRMITENVASNP